jgi:Asp-tRNA(Asn)/Glu-tRNA(Gln) amidotransferase C subunit
MGLRDILLNIQQVADLESDVEAVTHRITQINAILSGAEDLSESDKTLLKRTRSQLSELYSQNLPITSNSLLALLSGRLVSKFF